MAGRLAWVLAQHHIDTHTCFAKSRNGSWCNRPDGEHRIHIDVRADGSVRDIWEGGPWTWDEMGAEFVSDIHWLASIMTI